MQDTTVFVYAKGYLGPTSVHGSWRLVYNMAAAACGLACRLPFLAGESLELSPPPKEFVVTRSRDHLLILLLLVKKQGT